MTTLVVADDKGRICIRGTEPGRKYLVTRAGAGWWVTPNPEVPPPTRNRREWAGSKRSLAEHLRGLGDAGLRIEQSQSAKQPAPPCRF